MPTISVPTELSPGVEVNAKYRIMRMLGQGGMGRVYEVEHIHLKRTFALKQTFFTSTQEREWMRKEAERQSQLSHENLPKVTDFFEDKGNYYMVMDFITGSSLKDLITKFGPASSDVVQLIANQLLLTLEYLHAQSPALIHRDIKPDNIRISDKVFLLDFGLSKDMASGTLVAGYTPGYSSPEQMSGDMTDERSDIYSLGATLYSLLTALLPPDAVSRKRTVAAGKADPLQQIMEVKTDVPAGLASIVHKALALEPRDRYASAADMRQALKGVVSEITPVSSQDFEWAELKLKLEEQAKRRIIDPPIPKPIPRSTNILLGLIIFLLAVGLFFWPGGLFFSLRYKLTGSELDPNMIISVNRQLEPVSIRPGVKPYVFVVSGVGKVISGIPLKVTVFNLNDPGWYQELEHPELIFHPHYYKTLEEINNINWEYKFTHEDLNFDGAADLQFIGSAGASNNYKVCWIFHGGSYQLNETLTQIFHRYSEVRFDSDTKTIIVFMHRSGEPTWEQRYQWKDDQLVKIFDSDPGADDRPK